MTMRRAAVALAAVCFCLGASSAASAKSRKHRHHTRSPHGQHAGGSAAEGRAHLKRANALAGEGDCAAAIEEYTKAFELLDDPVVLFNRGECYRRTGDSENAVDDYREFLEKVPPEPSSHEPPAETRTPPPPPKAVDAVVQPPPTAPKPESKPEPAVVVRSPARVEDSGPGGGSRPWVWITLAVLVAGAAVGSYMMFRPGEEPAPTTTLGNYRF